MYCLNDTNGTNSIREEISSKYREEGNLGITIQDFCSVQGFPGTSYVHNRDFHHIKVILKRNF